MTPLSPASRRHDASRFVPQSLVRQGDDMKTLLALSTSLLLLGAVVPKTAWADSADANCEVRKNGRSQHGKSGPCTFGQRQGYIEIDLRNGDTYNLRPKGNANHFRDQWTGTTRNTRTAIGRAKKARAAAAHRTTRVPARATTTSTGCKTAALRSSGRLTAASARLPATANRSGTATAARTARLNGHRTSRSISANPGARQ